LPTIRRSREVFASNVKTGAFSRWLAARTGRNARRTRLRRAGQADARVQAQQINALKSSPARRFRNDPGAAFEPRLHIFGGNARPAIFSPSR
jgi:hypothetical protein